MKVGLAADHGGFEMKQQLAKLIMAGHEVVDFGNKVYDANDDYPDFAIPLARAVSRGDVERGVLLCGSCIGASVTANKDNEDAMASEKLAEGIRKFHSDARHFQEYALSRVAEKVH